MSPPVSALICVSMDVWSCSSVGCIGGTKNADSIYKVLAPVIDFYSKKDESGNSNYQDASPFSKIEIIEPFSQVEIFSEQKRPNTQKAKIDFVKALSKQSPYESSQIIKKDLVEKIYVSPSKLYEEAEKDEFKKSLENKNRTDLPFAEINEIIERHKNFDFNNFGTIAHSYLETS